MKPDRKFFTFIFLSLAMLLLAAPPVGALEYKIVTTVALPSDYVYGSISRMFPRINSLGQVVWLEHRPTDYTDPTLMSNMAVYLYSDGSVKMIAPPEKGPYRRWSEGWIAPSINSSGVIVWEGYSGGSPKLGYDIYQYSNGSYQSIVAGGQLWWWGFPQISNTGQVVFQGVKFDINARNIFSYNPSTQITADPAPLINTTPAVNNYGQIVYAKWENTWFSIYLIVNGTPTRIAAGWETDSEQAWNEQPQINDRGEIVWMQNIYLKNTYTYVTNVCLYSAGQTTILASYFPGNVNSRVRINNRGEVVWRNADLRIVLYSKGKIYTLPYKTDSYGGFPDINDSGTIAWFSSQFKDNSSEFNDKYLYLMLASPSGGSVAPILNLLLLD